MLRFVRGLSCLVAVWGVVGLTATAEAKIDTMEFFPAPTGSHLHFEMSGEPKYSISTDKNVNRVIIEVDRQSVDLSKYLTLTSRGFSKSYNDVVVRTVNVSQKDRNTVRITVDLNVTPDVDHALFNLGWKRYRLSLDFRRPKDLVEQRYDLADIRAFKARGGKIALVSAGHGGLDDGNTGIDLVEKHVNLDICFRLEEMMNKHRDRTGVMIVLARWGDYLPVFTKEGTWDWLQEMGSHYDADLFMEVHHNSCRGLPSQNGSEVFILGDTWLKKLESEEADRLRREGKSSSTARREAANLKYHNHRESKELAECVLHELDDIRGLSTRRGIKQANFMVLRRLDMPSTLIEGGFLNDPHDSSLAREPAFRERFAYALGYACVKYLTDKDIRTILPPPRWDGPPVKQYTVRKGDSLSGIASSFGVSQSSIKSANSISGTRIYAGQKLRIPGQAGVSVASAANNWGLLERPRYDPSYITPPSFAETRIHIVAAGDTLWGISERFNVPMSDLLLLNGYSRPEEAYLLIGQELRLPAVDASASLETGTVLAQLEKDYAGENDTPEAAEEPESAELEVAAAATEEPAAQDVIIVTPGEPDTAPVTPAAPLAPPRTYQVQRGDMLVTIAKAHGVGVGDLQKWNPSLKNPNRLQVGDTLVVSNPQAAAVLEQVQQDVAAAENAETEAPEEPAATEVAVEKKPEKLNLLTYTVKSGQTLYDIAREFPGISADNIARLNAIPDASTIQPGMELVIPPSDEVYHRILNSPQMLAALAEDGASALPLSLPEPVAGQFQNYTVRSGESLWQIANQFPGISTKAIQKANNLNGSRIHPGDVLRIPVQSTGKIQVTHQVNAGDNIWDIAKRYNTSVQSIRAANNLNSDVIKPNELLVIPVDSGS